MSAPDSTSAQPPEEPRSTLFVVDRREGAIVVLVDDDDRSIDVHAARLPRACRSEGAVIRVPLAPDGSPDWGRAKRDRQEERRRIAELAARVKRLQRSDPGGDIVL